MKYYKKYYMLFVIMIIFSAVNCTEEFEPKTEIFESLLVIEGNITDELKRHEILLSKTFRFEEENSSLGESNAEVMVVDNKGNEFIFEETTPGVYRSISPFQAVSGREYTLSIRTNDEKSYISSPMILPVKNEIDNLYVERMTNDEGLEGVGIFVDNFDPSGNASFYRYEFEETYRFNAPSFNDEDIVLDSEDPFVIDFVPRPQNKRTCYKTDVSQGIIITKTEDFDENRVSKFLVRFIGVDDYRNSDRYSILVHQFVQSREAHSFYENVKSFSSSVTLFSQTQPGFIEGNINSVDNSDENVLGFFQVTSTTTKRIFFNYRDFFPTEPIPPFFVGCESFAPIIVPIPVALINELNADRYLFDGETGVNNIFEGPYLLVPKICGDCTVLGTNKRPDFWED
ncbi:MULTISPECIES: DUF4249 domain-containing protein [Aquimarina]|nr:MULTISPECIES: DUF4249 domain-containing protein [Aquimarina]